MVPTSARGKAPTSRGGRAFASAPLRSAFIFLFVLAGCSESTEPLDTAAPLGVTDLAAIDTTVHSVTLSWTAPADKGTSGHLGKYDVRYATWPITNANWSDATQASGEPTPKLTGKKDTLAVTGLLENTDYYFALKTADTEANWSALSNVASARTQALLDIIPPSAIEDLAAGQPTEHTVTLTWTAPGDDGNVGAADEYDIRYSTSLITEANWMSASQAAHLLKPKTAGAQETFIVRNLAADSTYYFALKTADEAPNWSALSNVASARTLHEFAWSPMGEGMNGIVNALAVFNGELIAAGQFTTAGGITANRIAAWNGSSWSALGSGMNNAVYALTVYRGQLIAAGEFTTAGGIAANRIAVWNGSSWSALGAGTDNTVHCLTVYDDQLIAGGWFTSAGQAVVNYIAAWNGTSWAPIGSGMSGGYAPYVMGLGVYNGLLIAGGNFSTADGVPAIHVAAWNGAVWAPLGLGTDSFVDVLTVFNAQLIAGGAFTLAGGISSNHIAAWNGSSWAPLGSGMNNAVTSLIVDNNELVAGGFFNLAGNVATNIAVWDGSEWSSVGSGFGKNPPNPAVVYAIIPYNGGLAAAGFFDYSGDVPLSNIAIWKN